MASIMVSRIAILSVLAAVALAQTPTQSETPALQSFLSVSNLDASQVCLTVARCHLGRVFLPGFLLH